MFPLHGYGPTPATVSPLAGPANEEPLLLRARECGRRPQTALRAGRAAARGTLWPRVVGGMIREANLTKCELEKPQTELADSRPCAEVKRGRFRGEEQDRSQQKQDGDVGAATMREAPGIGR